MKKTKRKFLRFSKRSLKKNRTTLLYIVLWSKGIEIPFVVFEALGVLYFLDTLSLIRNGGFNNCLHLNFMTTNSIWKSKEEENSFSHFLLLCIFDK